MTVNISSPNVPGQLSSVRLASAGNLAGQYNNGPSNNGVNALLINSGSEAPLSIDSTPVNLGDRILLIAQTNTNENGLYFVKDPGSDEDLWILQRANDFQSISQMSVGQYLTIGDGVANIGKMYILEAPLPAQIGVDEITFAEVASGGGGGGQASNKDVTNNALPLVASVDGAFIQGDILISDDTAGTVADSGIAFSNRMNTVSPTLSGTPIQGNAVLFGDNLGSVGDSGFVLNNACTRQATDPSQPSVASVNPNATIHIGDGVLFHDTAGTLESTGAAAAVPTDPANGNVASVTGTPVVIGHIAVFNDVAGTITDGGAPPSVPSLPLSGANGGTGAANPGHQIILAGDIEIANNFTTLGNNTLTLTTTAPTSVTLPTSGTLATVAGSLQASNNLSDLNSVSNARTNLGLGSAALLASSAVAQTANNLSDLASAVTSRTNLGLGTAATQNSTLFLQVANNLSDVASASTSRTNLGVAIGTNVQAFNATLSAVAGGTYTGVSSITTLGTIGTGTWQGTIISPTYGGTGVNNGSNTVTLAGNLVTSGANSLTLTTTGPTNVTMPVSGTLLSATSGSFTPTISGSITNPTAITYTTQLGEYNVVGNQVFFYLRVTVATLTIGIAAGNIIINGLPVASANISNMIQNIVCTYGGVSFTGNDLTGVIAPNTQVANLAVSTTGIPFALAPITGIAVGTDIILTGYYFTS